VKLLEEVKGMRNRLNDIFGFVFFGHGQIFPLLIEINVRIVSIL
jgi:hypothetical protein